MKHYTAVVETSRRGNPSHDDVDAAMDSLAAYAPALSVSPRGYREARITFPADSFAQAASTAIAVVAGALGGDVVSLELMSEAEAELRAGSASVPELVGVTEAAELIGVTPQRVRQMIDEGKLAAHRVGERSFALVRSEVLAKAQPESTT